MHKPGRWYAMAATSDGATLNLYLTKTGLEFFDASKVGYIRVYFRTAN